MHNLMVLQLKAYTMPFTSSRKAYSGTDILLKQSEPAQSQGLFVNPQISKNNLRNSLKKN